MMSDDGATPILIENISMLEIEAEKLMLIDMIANAMIGYEKIQTFSE